MSKCKDTKSLDKFHTASIMYVELKMESDMYKCYNCGDSLKIEGGKVFRKDICPSCKKDVRVCLNCAMYEKHRENKCREERAETVADKEKANFCDYFEMKKHGEAKEKKDLSSLFKDGYKKSENKSLFND